MTTKWCGCLIKILLLLVREEPFNLERRELLAVHVAQRALLLRLTLPLAGRARERVEQRVEHLEEPLGAAGLVRRQLLIQPHEDVPLEVLRLVAARLEARVTHVELLAVGAHHARLLADRLQTDLAL